MPNIINFFAKNRRFVVFIILESIAFLQIIRYHNYHSSKVNYSVNLLTGSIQKGVSGMYSYFLLHRRNEDLKRENEALKNALEKLKEFKEKSAVPEDSVESKYVYKSAYVVHNSYRHERNLLTLDKGEKDGVEVDMGVVLPNGVVGIVLQTSPHFSTVLSLLNPQTGINVKLKNSNYYGIVTWKTGDYRYVNVEDLPVQSGIHKGDTLVTGAYSRVFPENIPVGIVSEYVKKNKEYEYVKVKLFADFSALHRVYIVENKMAEEQKKLEEDNEK